MKKLHISKRNKMLFGVCAGLSESLGIDVSIIRLIFIVSIFLGGTGAFIYLILAAILPKIDEKQDIIDVEATENEEEKQTTKIFRVWEDRMIAGVCTGFARYLKWDVSLIRLIFILMSIGGGTGIVLYIIFWFIFPNEDSVQPEQTDEENN